MARNPLGSRNDSDGLLASAERAPLLTSGTLDALVYTPDEEGAVLHMLDMHLMSCIMLAIFVLSMGDTNNSNAISDNLNTDLGFSLDVVNAATAVSSVLFAIACLSGAIISKIVGPARWIPILMFSGALVTLSHALISDKLGYITVRAFISLTQGGIFPTILVYLGSFYKSDELATRLAWLGGASSIAWAISGLMAGGLLKLRGIWGLQGWKWLFIVNGIIALIVAIGTWFYLPRSLSKTSGGSRGRIPWLTPRQIQIAMARVIRDDTSKRSYGKTVTWADFKDTITDLGVIGHIIITMIGQTPNVPLQTYFPTIIKSFHFDVSVASALTAPPYIFSGIVMIVAVHHSDKVRERGFHGAFGAGWQLAGWIFLRSLPPSASRGLKYCAIAIVASGPSTNPLNIAWLSENSGTIGKRTVSSGLITGSSGIFSIWASQIYRADDAPDFKRGNLVNIAFASIAFALWFLQKYLYTFKNARNAWKVKEMTEAQRRAEEPLREAKGNRGCLFRFAT